MNLQPDAYRHDDAEAARATFLTFLKNVFAGQWDATLAIWRFGADSSIDYDLAGLRNRDAGGGQARLA